MGFRRAFGHRLSDPPTILKLSLEFSQYPLLGKELRGRRQRVEAYVTRPRELYAEGYRRFKEQIYRLTTTDGGSYGALVGAI